MSSRTCSASVALRGAAWQCVAASCRGGSSPSRERGQVGWSSLGRSQPLAGATPHRPSLISFLIGDLSGRAGSNRNRRGAGRGRTVASGSTTPASTASSTLPRASPRPALVPWRAERRPRPGHDRDASVPVRVPTSPAWLRRSLAGAGQVIPLKWRRRRNQIRARDAHGDAAHPPRTMAASAS